MTDDQLLRYSRHILLDEVGIEGQERVLAAHALIIGAGGLRSRKSSRSSEADLAKDFFDITILSDFQRTRKSRLANLGLDDYVRLTKLNSAYSPRPKQIHPTQNS